MRPTLRQRATGGLPPTRADPPLGLGRGRGLLDWSRVSWHGSSFVLSMHGRSAAPTRPRHCDTTTRASRRRSAAAEGRTAFAGVWVTPDPTPWPRRAPPRPPTRRARVWYALPCGRCGRRRVPACPLRALRLPCLITDDEGGRPRPRSGSPAPRRDRGRHPRSQVRQPQPAAVGEARRERGLAGRAGDRPTWPVDGPHRDAPRASSPPGPCAGGASAWPGGSHPLGPPPEPASAGPLWPPMGSFAAALMRLRTPLARSGIRAETCPRPLRRRSSKPARACQRCCGDRHHAIWSSGSSE